MSKTKEHDQIIAARRDNLVDDSNLKTMSDKKIFIALSQREARSVITAIQFLACGCSNHNLEKLEFNAENAEIIGITAKELCELHEFKDRLELLADEQAELETSIENQSISNREKLKS